MHVSALPIEVRRGHHPGAGVTGSVDLCVGNETSVLCKNSHTLSHCTLSLVSFLALSFSNSLASSYLPLPLSYFMVYSLELWYLLLVWLLRALDSSAFCCRYTADAVPIYFFDSHLLGFTLTPVRSIGLWWFTEDVGRVLLLSVTSYSVGLLHMKPLFLAHALHLLLGYSVCFMGHEILQNGLG